MAASNSQADLYLRGAFDMNPSPTTPGPIAALDTLLRLTHQMQDMQFQYTFIDKPRAGTSAIVWHDPSRTNWPSDGVRYLSQAQDLNGPHAGEKFSTSSHPMPNNVAGIVELETGVVSGGIFPPSNPAIPLSKDSPELVMARYRLRWRIVTPGLGNLALWLVYWGRDERTTQRAPPGWEREPIRRYPLPTLPPNVPPQQPLRKGRALPPPPLIEPVNSRTTSASPAPSSLPHTLQQNHQNRQASYTDNSTQQQYTPQHQQQPSLPPNMQQQPPSLPQAGDYPGYQQARPPNMQVGPGPGPPPGSSQGPPLPPQVLQHTQVQQQHQQPAQSRRNTPKQSHAALSKKPPPPGLGKPNSQPQAQSQSHPPPPNAAVAAAVQPQVQALQAIPPHLRAAVVASAAHSVFPQAFSDPYDYLSSRSWAGLRYERNHAVVAPIFDPSTTTELMESWIEPSYPDLDKIKEEISLLQKEVDVLKARQLPLPSKTSLNSSTNGAAIEGSGVTSQQLARKTSVISGSVFRDRDKDSSKQKEVESLLAPLPRMMPIAEMHDRAMQAYNARRKEIEEALQAQRAAKEEEERIEREQREAEEAAKRAVEEEAREQEKKEREAREAEQMQREEQERKANQGKEIQGMPSPKLESNTSQQQQQQANQVQGQMQQAQQASGQEGPVQNGHQPQQIPQQQQQQQPQAQQPHLQSGNLPSNNSINNSNIASGQETPQDGGTAANYFDDSYNLLMDNFGMYGGNGGGYDTMGGGIPGDEMMDDSLFSEYMDQMGSM